MKINSCLSCSIFYLSLLGCSSEVPQQAAERIPETSQTQAPPPRSESARLEEDYARLRSGQVRDVDYTLSLDLTDAAVFRGTVTISFELLRDNMPLTIDFDGGEVVSLQVNGQAVAYTYNGWFISIDPDVLDQGHTVLEIAYTHPYSTTGAGLYRFVDPVDERVYLYTDFEPYDANGLFPAFDQPDIKAGYLLDVRVPEGWQVISSTREREVVAGNGVSHWFFPPSARFSTYIFSLHAGEYAVWEAEAGDIPLRLFARRSLQEYVVPEDWFAYTRHGFAFYQDYFGIAYPFGKYDQVIVPDFNAGAMENVGAVTFTENLIKRGAYTQGDKDRINTIILHEMAHMWFGDLVTMRWWNGLWLNESFATYMSALAEAGQPDNDRAWLRFFLGSKLSAYSTDEQVTNHPIELPVADTDSAFANFDGITYGKGASVLKQLSFLLGADNFRRGVGNYLQDMAYANSEIEDFTGALAAASGRDLSAWSKQWLYEKGLNNLAFDYQCEGGVIKSFELLQSSPPREASILREHRLQIALYRDGAVTHVETVTLNGASLTVDALVGKPCPDFIYPNHDDQAYIKVLLPEKEFAVLATGINRFQDPLVRAMLWRNLWEAVQDARLPLQTYAGIVLNNITSETTPDILRQIFGNIDSLFAYYYQFGGTYADAVREFGERYEALAWAQINAMAPGSDLQTFWYDSLVANTASEAGLARIATLLKGDMSIEGLELDQDRRWRIVRQLAAHDFPEIEQIAENELARDPSANGRKAVLAAQAARPDPERKAVYLTEIQDLQNARPLAEKREIMQNLLQPHQVMVTKAMLADVLAPLGSLDREGESQFIRGYAGMIKGHCEEVSAALLEQAIEENADASLTVSKALRIALQDDQRCMAIKALAGSE